MQSVVALPRANDALGTCDRMTVVDRPVDFFRDRQMLCGDCDHRWTVDLEWIDRWEQAQAACPGCGMTCEEEAAPRVTVADDDPALIDSNVPRLYWYHTSTIADWPPEHLDPAAKLTERTRLMMGGDESVARWAERQRSKALHVGTYEAAIHNMLRRIDHQADHGKQLYLYRVRLKATIGLRDGWLIDPSNFVGDVILDEVCAPGIDAARYLNYHEDPGGLSLAIGRDAVAATQRVAIPSEPVGSEDLVSVTQRLPVNLREHFGAASVVSDTAGSTDWRRYVMGLAGLIFDVGRVLNELDAQDVRHL